MSNETTFNPLELPVHVNGKLGVNPALVGKTSFTHSMTSPANQPTDGRPLTPTPFQDAPDTGATSRTACATASGAVIIAQLTTEQTALAAQLTAVNALLPAATVTVTSVAAATGTVNGGTAVTITGTGFNFPVTVPTTVTFQGIPASNVVVVSATSITCTTPKGVWPGPVGVSVSSSLGVGYRPNAFTYTASAAFGCTITPNTGLAAGATNVQITGYGFTGATGVTVGGGAATNFVVVSDTVITCTTPAHAVGANTVVITKAAGNATMTNAFTYQ
jgi:hypothetical protein